MKRGVRITVLHEMRPLPRSADDLTEEAVRRQEVEAQQEDVWLSILAKIDPEGLDAEVEAGKMTPERRAQIANRKKELEQTGEL